MAGPLREDDASPAKSLSGGGVAVKVSCALEGCAPEEMLSYYGDLVAVGTVADMMALTAGAKMAVGMRLHCLIYAAAAGVPVIGLSYDPKIDALMKCLGQPYVYDSETVTADSLREAAEAVLADEEAIRTQICTAAGEMRVRCLEDVAAAAAMIRQNGHTDIDV